MACTNKSYIDERVEEIANTPTVNISAFDDLVSCPDPIKPNFETYILNINSNTHFGDIRTAQSIKNIIKMYDLYVDELEDTIQCYKILFNAQ